MQIVLFVPLRLAGSYHIDNDPSRDKHDDDNQRILNNDDKLVEIVFGHKSPAVTEPDGQQERGQQGHNIDRQ